MHLAKGLEFRGVAVMACDDEVLPLQERIESVTDESDLEEVYNTERHLLYVACTRARDRLLITGIAPGSEFLADMAVERSGGRRPSVAESGACRTGSAMTTVEHVSIAIQIRRFSTWKLAHSFNGAGRQST